MATEHLFYTLRMLYNHSVPPVFRVGQFKRHPNVFKWPLDYKTQAGQAMRAAFNKRNDIEDWMRNELDDMERNAEFLEMVRMANLEMPMPTIAAEALFSQDELNRSALA